MRKKTKNASAAALGADRLIDLAICGAESKIESSQSAVVGEFWLYVDVCEDFECQLDQDTEFLPTIHVKIVAIAGGRLVEETVTRSGVRPGGRGWTVFGKRNENTIWRRPRLVGGMP